MAINLTMLLLKVVWRDAGVLEIFFLEF